jgi:putative YhbY family RNA-binding protein
MPPSLSPRERQKLKARAHGLEPVVHVGQAGVTAKLLSEIDRALAAHELIKIKVAGPDRDAREALCDEIVSRAEAGEVQRVGKVLVLWRPRPEDDTNQE